MFTDIVEVTAPDDKDFVEAVFHFCGAMDLNSADDMDDYFYLV